MSISQSPQRNRKTQVHNSIPAPMQNTVAPREASPSPSFRERQRALKAHSMPVVPSVAQLLSNPAQQNPQASPTIAAVRRASPPPTSRISPVTAKISTNGVPNSSHLERSPERLNSPPPLLHSLSQPIVTQLASSGPQASQSNVAAHQPRPIPRVPPPTFLTQYQTLDQKWGMTEELLAEIERADQQQGQLQGTSGVAYAGGAASNSNLNLHTAKDPAVERVRAIDRSSPKDADNGGVKRPSREKERDTQNTRESPKTRERAQTTSSISSQQTEVQSHQQNRTPEYRGSPQYQTPMASPGERTAGYAQYIPDNYQPGPTPPAARKPPPLNPAELNAARATPPGSNKRSPKTPPLSQQPTRPAGRSLPVQEEPEEDVGHDFPEHEPDYIEHRHGSPTPSSDLYPEGHSTRYDPRREHTNGVHHADDDDDETLNEEVDERLQQQSKSGDDSDAGYTPRSPSTNLPERPPDGSYPISNGQYVPTVQYSQAALDAQKTIRAKHRAGSTDQLGMRSFDPAMFEHTMSSLRTNGQGHSTSPNGQRQFQPSRSPPQQQQQQPPPLNQPQPQPILQQQQPQFQAAPRQHPVNRVGDQQMRHHEEFQNIFDGDPTSSYLQAFFQQQSGNRPGAPIPPTPHSQTNMASPPPVISAMPSDVEARQIGSPYPYPFTHIRRNTMPIAQAAPSTNVDHNNPAFVREQLRLQMQIYALNNGFTPASESAFSPSSTPFPGTGYNPWGFMQQPARPGDANMSLRSSPSHEPVSLPMAPAMRGRGLRRKDMPMSTRAQVVARRRVKPPPRVDSTQPRETSPEPSSGEETAGEERFVEPYVADGEIWVNGINGTVDAPDDSAEWIDEDDDEHDDLLELEFHPSYISNSEKRRRKWETRWDALTQAFQALDRETDATLMLLAAPSHSTKLHALTSRSIRREASLRTSPALAGMRTGFSQIASQRRISRTRRASLADRLSSAGSGSSADGSPGSSESREEDLRRALGSALGSLSALGSIYEQREARWRDEMRRLSEDRERVELLLGQALGTVLTNGHDLEQPLL